MAARVCFLLLLLGIPIFAGEEINEFVEVDLVDLYLTATDSKGRFIGNLTANEIQIKENGVPQEIDRFGVFAGERNEIPLLLAVVIDNSGSMDSGIGQIRRLDLSRNVAMLLLKQLGPLDRVLLGQFSDKPEISQLTQDTAQIEKLLTVMRPVWGQTAVVDSLATVIQELNKNAGRKVVLLCTDGQDNLSKARFIDVMKMAADATDLTIVILGVGATNVVFSTRGGEVKNIPDIPYLRSKEYLQRLADTTAGFAYFPETEKDVAGVLEKVSTFIQSQYYLAYHSSNSANESPWRRIEITTRRKGVTLHYRQGYARN